MHIYVEEMYLRNNFVIKKTYNVIVDYLFKIIDFFFLLRILLTDVRLYKTLLSMRKRVFTDSVEI